MTENNNNLEFEEIRSKGFVSLSQPYTQLEDNTQEQIFLNNQSNYEEYLDSLTDEQLNEHGLPPYNLTFYQIEEQDGVCSFYPGDVNSSAENQISPLQWPQFASCLRIGKNRFLVTGGVALNGQYMSTFLQKFKLQKNKHEQTVLLRSQIELLKKKPVENASTEDLQKRNQDIFRLINAALDLVKDKEEQEALKNESDEVKRDEMIEKIFQEQIQKITKQTTLLSLKSDQAYCKKQNITYNPTEEEIAEEQEIINKNSPYQSTTIELSFNFIPEDNTYQFTGKYLSPMPKPRSNHQTVFHKGKVYVLGGVCNQKVQSSVLVYDVLEDTWSEEFPGLSHPRVSFSAVSHGDYIYVFGGHTTSFVESNLDDSVLERINTENNDKNWQQFTYKKKINFTGKFSHKQQLQLISYQDSLLLMGGFDSTKLTENAVLISKIEIAGTDKWNLSYLEGSTFAVRKGAVVARGTYKSEDCFFILGGAQKILLECFKLNNENGKLSIEKILDNEYDQEIASYNPTFIPVDPSLYLE